MILQVLCRCLADRAVRELKELERRLGGMTELARQSQGWTDERRKWKARPDFYSKSARAHPGFYNKVIV